jgi:glutathione synthase/RimK-type ligase-like ATP-grasp enzyme
MKVAVVTSKNAAGMSEDDPILLAALERAGHQAHLWSWDDPEADWSSVDVALVRSTWDYFERPDEFVAWLEATRSQVRFINDVETLIWNLDKRYLIELAEAGLPVVPSELATLSELDDAIKRVWDDRASAIVKPVISGGSWGLHHRQVGSKLKPDPAQGPWLVQPFAKSIMKEGELSVIILGGEISHGIRKLPKDGDIRVQREFGGREMVERPSPEAARLAMDVLAACPGECLYARADIVERDGRLELMEMELLEPELFFVKVPEAADRLAKLL